MFDRVLDTPLFLILPKVYTTAEIKEVEYLHFTFDENLYLFQFTRSRVFSLFKIAIFLF